MAMSQEFLARIKLVMEGSADAATKLEQIKKGLDGVREPTTKASGAMNDFEKAFRRALIVAPVWMVARETIKQTIDFVKEGIQYYIDTEKAILNVKSSIMSMGEAGQSTITELTSRFHSLSVETGKTEASIMNIYAAVNRILGDTEKSYLATNSAVKLSVATGVDAAKIAESVSFMYKLQGDSLKGAATDAQKFQEISELLYATQAKTPGGLEKLITDVRGFSATMNLADFGIENTIKLFGALESSGISSGQVLRTGVMKVLTNIDEVSKMLGMSIPQNLTPFQAFTMVLEKLGGALKPGQLNANTFSVIKDIFGTGARGAGQVASLARDIDSLRTALSGSGTTERDRYLYQKQINDVNNSAQHQIEIFGNLKKQAGESFITGILDGRNFADAMKNANNIMTEGIRIAGNLGIMLNSLKYVFAISPLGLVMQATEAAKARTEVSKSEFDLQTRIQMALKGQLTLEETNALVGEVSISKLIAEEGLRKRILDLLQNQSIAEAKKGAEISKNNEKMAQANILAKKQADELENLILQYAKATAPEEKAILKRKIELTQMTPEQQIMAFENSKKDRALLLEIVSKLPEEVRSVLTGKVAMEAGILTGGRFPTSLPFNREPLVKPGERLTSINQKGADLIQIYVDAKGKKLEDMIQVIKNAIENKLLTDEDFQKVFGKKLGNKIQ